MGENDLDGHRSTRWRGRNIGDRALGNYIGVSSPSGSVDPWTLADAPSGMPTREFDLDIERALENWTLANAIRELFANALDEADQTRR